MRIYSFYMVALQSKKSYSNKPVMIKFNFPVKPFQIIKSLLKLCC